MSFSYRVVAAFAAFSLSVLSACSSPQEGASAEQISSALAVELTSGLEVRDLEVTAIEPLGTDESPRFRTRSTAIIAYTEDFYREIGEIDGRPLVTRVASAGDTLSGTLVTMSTPQGDENWRVQFERVDFPPMQGEAASRFGSREVVVEGSDEYEAIRTRIAEEEAAAEAARLQRVADLTAALAGRWVSSAPVTRDGAVYEHRGYQAGYELNLEPANGNTGTGTGSMYVYSQPDDSVSTGVGYTIDESGEFATVTFSGRAYHRQLRTNAGRGMQWRLTADGRMTAQSGRETWVAQLSKQ